MAIVGAKVQMSGRPENPIERHAQTAVLALILSLMFWVGNSILNLADKWAQMSVHLAQIDERIAYVQTQVGATYRSKDAERDVLETKEQINTLQWRVSALESAINVCAKTTKELSEWQRKP